MAMYDQVLSTCWCCQRGKSHHRKVMARHARRRDSAPPPVPMVVAVASKSSQGQASTAGRASPAHATDSAGVGSAPHANVDAKQCWDGSGHEAHVVERHMSSKGSFDPEEGDAPAKRLPRTSDGGRSTTCAAATRRWVLAHVCVPPRPLPAVRHRPRRRCTSAFVTSRRWMTCGRSHSSIAGG